MTNTVRRSDIGNFYEVRDSDGDLIADYVPDQTLAYHFAVAPELLAVISEMLGAAETDRLDDKSNVWRSCMISARAAIAKAEGRGE